MPIEFKWREYHNIWNYRDHNDYMRDIIYTVVTDGYNLAILDSSADTPKNAYLAKRNETKNTLQVESFQIDHFSTFILDFAHLVRMNLKILYRINCRNTRWN